MIHTFEPPCTVLTKQGEDATESSVICAPRQSSAIIPKIVAIHQPKFPLPLP